MPSKNPQSPQQTKQLLATLKSRFEKNLHRHKPGPDDPAPLFDSGIGDWLLNLTAVAMIALILGTIARWAYLALFVK